jgi:beta-glucanase (GH16 family)
MICLVAAAVAGCSAEEPRQPGGTGRQTTVSIEVLPPVAQPGPTPAASEDGLLHVASVRPADPGSEVWLQERRDGGWQTVARARQDEGGTATFAADEPAGADVRALLPDSDVTSRPVRPRSWSPALTEEFDGEQLDTSLWSYRQLGSYNPDGSRQCSKSDESAVAVGGGVLTLSVLRDPARTGEKCVTPEDGTHGYYLNGHISTDGRFELEEGVAAARVKFQRERGQHGAFWLQREGVEQVPGDPGVSGAEIDVAEYFGEGYQKGGLASFVYYTNADGEAEKVGGLWPAASRQLPAGDAWWRRYHVFSVEWTADRYVFRVDGRETFRTTEGVSGVPQFLVLSLLSSDWELGKIDDEALPSSMEVDWVRAWREAAGNPAGG